jgi:hypothetical protein
MSTHELWLLPDDPDCGAPQGNSISNHYAFWKCMPPHDRAAARAFLESLGAQINAAGCSPEILGMALIDIAGGMIGALPPGQHRDQTLDLAIRLLRGGAQKGALPGSGIYWSHAQAGRA